MNRVLEFLILLKEFLVKILEFSVLEIRVLDVLILVIAVGLALIFNAFVVDRMIPTMCQRLKDRQAAHAAQLELEARKAEEAEREKKAKEKAEIAEAEKKRRAEEAARNAESAEGAGESPASQNEGEAHNESAADAAEAVEKTESELGAEVEPDSDSEGFDDGAEYAGLSSEIHAAVSLKRERLPLFDILFSSLGKPIHYMTVAIALGVALMFVHTPSWAFEIRPWLFSIIRAVTIWCVILYLLRVTGRCKDHYAKIAAQTKDDKLDDMLVPLISGGIKFLLVAFGVLVVIDNLGYSVSSLVAGLGIGGAALALASKDTLANLFGAFVVFVDKPFQIGDWISVGGIEGEVEEIRMRTTLIRTWNNSVVTLPNSVLSTSSVDNYERRKYRKMDCDFGVLYSTKSEQIEQIVADIKAYLAEHVIDTAALDAANEKIKAVHNNHRLTDEEKLVAIERVKYKPKPGQMYGPNYYVGFKGFGDSSLDIEVVAFTYRTNKAGHMEDRQTFLLEIMRIVERNGTSFAFPTRTLEWAGMQSKIPVKIEK